MTTDPEETGYGLVMPFVVCASQGGPYDDEAFVSGWTLGAINMALNIIAPTGAQYRAWVKPAHVPQLDLIAMKHGRQLFLGDLDDSGEWRYIEIDVPKPESGSGDD